MAGWRTPRSQQHRHRQGAANAGLQVGGPPTRRERVPPRGGRTRGRRPAPHALAGERHLVESSIWGSLLPGLGATVPPRRRADDRSDRVVARPGAACRGLGVTTSSVVARVAQAWRLFSLPLSRGPLPPLPSGVRTLSHLRASRHPSRCQRTGVVLASHRRTHGGSSIRGASPHLPSLGSDRERSAHAP